MTEGKVIQVLLCTALSVQNKQWLCHYLSPIVVASQLPNTCPLSLIFVPAEGKTSNLKVTPTHKTKVCNYTVTFLSSNTRQFKLVWYMNTSSGVMIRLPVVL